MDWGLIGGLAEGFKSGVTSYGEAKEKQEQKRREQEKMDLEKKNQKAMMARYGLIETPEGDVQKSEEEQELERMRAARPAFGMDSSEQLKQLQIKRAKREEEDAAYKKTPKGKVTNLSAEQKQRFDNVNLALRSLTGMEGALEKGENTFSLIGDNPYTAARSQWEEAVGRMQSGGAISTSEAERFKKLVPGPLDSSEMQKQKLQQMREIMTERFKTFGIEPEQAEEVGLKPEAMGFLPKDQMTAGLIPKSGSSTAKPSMSGEDQAAISWAKANAGDPRAAKILQQHGMK